MDNLVKGPIFFEKNRVFRIYTGGALFADFFGDDSIDGFEPEEWIASSVKALNKESKGEKEGISCVKGTNIYFDDLLKSHPKELLGDRKNFGVLTKILDSAVRLPVQAHPSKEYSRKYFNSNYGKAESWIILATRKNAKIYFGFKNKITKEKFAKAVTKSKTNKNAMPELLNEISVNPGDVFFVPAQMVHAIGKGCLILEVQEPTDFTIQPEYFCDDYALSEQEMYLGLNSNIALDVFDYNIYGKKAIALGRRHPKLIKNTKNIKKEVLISYKDTPCFSVERYTLFNTSIKLLKKPAEYIVTEGIGEIIFKNHKQTLKKGSYFFMPYAAKNVTVKTNGSLQMVVCLPPKE